MDARAFNLECDVSLGQKRYPFRSAVRLLIESVRIGGCSYGRSPRPREQDPLSSPQTRDSNISGWLGPVRKFFVASGPPAPGGGGRLAR